MVTHPHFVFLRPLHPGVSVPSRRRMGPTRRLLHTLMVMLAVPTPHLRAQGTITVHLEDYASVPQSGTSLDGGSSNSSYVARVNFLRQDPSDADQFWVNDLNGRLYLLDKTTRAFTAYLNFNGRGGGNNGMFNNLSFDTGYSGGFVTFQFHPEFAVAGSPDRGKFYTVHQENPDTASYTVPNNTNAPNTGLDTSGYSKATLAAAPGPAQDDRHCVLIEWQDSDISNTTFEGTARELLRSEINHRIHPVGDLLFNPLATDASHTDWENLYIASGDGADGETTANADRHDNPQSLDNLVGKILRIHPADPDGSGSARYGIPASNPFVGTAGARGEILAYGFRNPHRFSWDPVTDKLFVSDIGYVTWEEVNIVEAGKNHGWAKREGIQTFNPIGTPGSPDQVTVPLLPSPVTPVYPVAAYDHASQVGDAVGGGFVYRGSLIPALQGKFIFGDVTTGRVWYCLVSDLIAAQDGDRTTLATKHNVDFLWDSPFDVDTTPEAYTLMYYIAELGYDFRGGPANNLPGTATASDAIRGVAARTDLRMGVDGNGELYFMTKSDGMVRRVVGLQGLPAVSADPADQIVAAGTNAIFAVSANGTPAPDYQWQRLPAAGGAFTNLANGGGYGGADTNVLTIAPAALAMDDDRFRCVVTNANGTAITADASLTVAPSAWHLTHFTVEQLGDPAISGDTVDNDHDGLNNLLESAFNMNPWVGSPHGLPQAQLANNGTQIHLQFTKNRPELTYTVEFSNDLVTWHDDVPDVAAFETTASGNNVTSTYMIAADTRVFLHVVVRAP